MLSEQDLPSFFLEKNLRRWSTAGLKLRVVIFSEYNKVYILGDNT